MISADVEPVDEHRSVKPTFQIAGTFQISEVEVSVTRRLFLDVECASKNFGPDDGPRKIAHWLPSL